jgi:hypothetical protein
VKNNARLGRRRSQRVTLSVPIVVSETDHKHVIERTRSVAVNRYGGLIELHAKVDWGQSLMLTNPFSRVDQECRVVYLGPSQQDKRVIGIEFTEPVSNFWNISFPAYGARALGAT